MILADGRRFRIDTIDMPSRGWWFSATAERAHIRLEANWPLIWDEAAKAWRPG
jgi:hypothetical protein